MNAFQLPTHTILTVVVVCLFVAILTSLCDVVAKVVKIVAIALLIICALLLIGKVILPWFGVNTSEPPAEPPAPTSPTSIWVPGYVQPTPTPEPERSYGSYLDLIIEEWLHK